MLPVSVYGFFFNDTATTEIYTLSLHDALPILSRASRAPARLERRSPARRRGGRGPRRRPALQDRKSTRLNSSHLVISYAVFCLKKKNINKTILAGLRMTPRSIQCCSPVSTCCV